VGDHNNFSKIPLDGFNDLDQALQTLAVLRAKALVNHQGAQARAGPTGQHLGQGDTQGEVDAESLAAGEELVVARAKGIADFDIERLSHFAGTGIALGL
jgi:hypothetical protein